MISLNPKVAICRQVSFFLLALFLVYPAGSNAGDISWDSYPAYYELDEWEVDWTTRRGLTIDVHRIIRVNRTSGESAGRIQIWDTFFQQLKYFEGTVTDTLGRVLFRLGDDNVTSLAPFSEFRLFSGDVIRTANLVAPQPPYIVEARWTVEIDNPFFWPDWVLSDQWPRRHARYQASVPRRYEIHYQQVAPSLIRTQSTGPRADVYTWELHDWIPEDMASFERQRTTPLLHVAPSEFRVGGESGSTDSWEHLGEWYWKFTKDRLGLTTDQAQATAARVEDVIGDRSRASILKDWISDEWRYVAIEIGLGGWRPHPSSDVFDNRYGDCKDVVFLWISMLQTLGIEAHPALIRSRSPLPVDPGFPKDWFDHVIAMAVINGDTLWTDPSDARYRMGSLPRNCEQRWALVVDKDGGHLVQTPCRSSIENRQVVYCEGELDTEGNLSFNARITSSGHFASMTPADGGRNGSALAAAILGVLPAAITATIDGIDIVSPSEIATRISGHIDGWAIGGTRRMVVRPRLCGWMAADTLSGRLDPGWVGFPLRAFDTLIVRFPPNWQPELWPAAEFHSTGNGEFGEARGFEGGQLEIVRHLRWEECDRSADRRMENAALRTAYRDAQSGEWVFQHPDEIERPNSPGEPSNTERTTSRGTIVPTTTTPDHQGGE